MSKIDSSLYGAEKRVAKRCTSSGGGDRPGGPGGGVCGGGHHHQKRIQNILRKR